MVVVGHGLWAVGRGWSWVVVGVILVSQIPGQTLLDCCLLGTNCFLRGGFRPFQMYMHVNFPTLPHGEMVRFSEVLPLFLLFKIDEKLFILLKLLYFNHTDADTEYL